MICVKRRLLSVLLAAVTLVSALGVACSAYAADKQAVFNHYSKSGSYKVKTFEFTVDANDYTYKVWYPKDIAKMSKRPIILYCNGTGSTYAMENKTSAILKKAASYGYVCLCNTDENTGTGASMDAGMTKLVEYSKNKNSRLYKKLDLKRVGLAGHSQGATCTLNLTDSSLYTNAKYYKAIYAASLPTNAIEEMQNCPYDSTKVKLPTCLVAGTGMTDAQFISPIDSSLIPSFENIKSDVYLARMKGVEHAGSFEAMHPYMLAWFDYQFYGKALAAKAFTGKYPELKTNPDWQDFRCKIRKKSLDIKNAKGKKGAFYVSWSKLPTANGYKIEYATKKNFKNKKTVTVTGASKVKKTVKKLKAKTYYVRVRAYTRVGRKMYYSKYTKTAAVKVK